MKIGENATGFIKAAAGSPRVHPGEPMKNAAEICSVIDQAEALKADVLVLPELVLSGYTAADLFLRAPLLEGVLTALECIKDHLKRRDSSLSLERRFVRMAGFLTAPFSCKTAGF